jgi:hypothetical protein
VNRRDSGLAQLAQEHEQGEGELEAAPMSEDIAPESEVASEAHSEHDETDDRSNASGGQHASARALLLWRETLRRHWIVHCSESCHGLDV